MVKILTVRFSGPQLWTATKDKPGELSMQMTRRNAQLDLDVFPTRCSWNLNFPKEEEQ